MPYGWFMCYAFSIGDGGRLQMGSVAWRSGDSPIETPIEKLNRWANDKANAHRQFVMVNWKALSKDEFFELDSETHF